MSEPQRTPCPHCAKPAALDAVRCPHCRGSLAVDLTIAAALTDDRRRYQVARALSALGPPLPGLAALREALGVDGGVLARALSRGAAERLAASLAADHQLETVARPSSGTPARRQGDTPFPAVATRRTHRGTAIAISAVAIVALAAIALVFQSIGPRLTASAQEPLSAAALQAVAEKVGRSRGMVRGHGVGPGYGVFVAPELFLARANPREAQDADVDYGERRRSTGRIVEADADPELVLVRVPDAAVEPLPLADATTVRDGDVLIVVEHGPGRRAVAKNAAVTNAAAVHEGASVIQVSVTLGESEFGAPVVDRRGRAVGLIVGKDSAARLAWVLPVNYAYAWLPGVKHDQAAWELRTAPLRRGREARDVGFATALERPLLISARHVGAQDGPAGEVLVERFLLVVAAPAWARSAAGPLRVRIGPCDVDAKVTWMSDRSHPPALAAFDRWADAQGVADQVAVGYGRATLDRRVCATPGAREVALVHGGEAAAAVPLED